MANTIRGNRGAQPKKFMCMNFPPFPPPPADLLAFPRVHCRHFHCQGCIINLFEVEAEDRRVDQLRNYWWSWPFWLSSCHHQKVRRIVQEEQVLCSRPMQVVECVIYLQFLYSVHRCEKNKFRNDAITSYHMFVSEAPFGSFFGIFSSSKLH